MEMEAALKRLSSDDSVNMDVDDGTGDGTRKRKIDDMEESTDATPTSAPVTVPVPSLSTFPSWFNTQCISAVEVRYLPEFFTDTARAIANPNPASDPTNSASVTMVQKNPTSYMNIRNFIIGLSKRLSSATGNTKPDGLTETPGNANNPAINTNYLSATDCRKLISGDVCSILRIHEFLDVFGIINGSVPLECKPVAYTVGSGLGFGSTSAPSVGSSLVSSSMHINSTLSGMDPNHSSVRTLNHAIATKKGVGTDTTNPTTTVTGTSTVWSESMDKALLKAVHTQQKKCSLSMQFPTGAGAGSTTGGVKSSSSTGSLIDWESIAEYVNDNKSDSDGGVGLNGQQCLERFVTRSLGDTSNLTETGTVSKPGSNNSTGPIGQSAVMQCIDALGPDTTSAIVNNTIQLVTKQMNDRMHTAAKQEYKNASISCDSIVNQVMNDSNSGVNTTDSATATGVTHGTMQSAVVCALQTAVITEEVRRNALESASTPNNTHNNANNSNVATKRVALYDRLNHAMCDYYHSRMGAMEEKVKSCV